MSISIVLFSETSITSDSEVGYTDVWCDVLPGNSPSVISVEELKEFTEPKSEDRECTNEYVELPKAVTISELKELVETETITELPIIPADSIVEDEESKSLPDSEELNIDGLSTELKITEEDEIDELRTTEFEIKEEIEEVLVPLLEVGTTTSDVNNTYDDNNKEEIEEEDTYNSSASINSRVALNSVLSVIISPFSFVVMKNEIQSLST